MHVNLYTFLINIDYCINFDTLFIPPADRTPTHQLTHLAPRMLNHSTVKFDIVQIETLNIDSNLFRNPRPRGKEGPNNRTSWKSKLILGWPPPLSGNGQLNGLAIRFLEVDEGKRNLHATLFMGRVVLGD